MSNYNDKRIKKIIFVVTAVLMMIACISMIVFFVTFAIGASLGIEIYATLFSYISFVASLGLLVVPMSKRLNFYVQKNKSFCLIIGIAVAVFYACIRIICFPNVFQVEQLLTAIIILLSYFVWVLMKDKA